MNKASRSFLALGPHGFHRIAYTEWGEPGNPRVLICVHGLTRSGRDFDVLAPALADRYRVLCPDVVGRGASDWLPPVHKQDYNYQTYCADMAALAALSGAETVDWVGTSMGGIIGMLLAAQPNTPIRRLVLNDIGPHIALAGLERIKGYAGTDPRFPDFMAAYRRVRETATAFGPMTEAQWGDWVRNSVRRLPDGSFAMNYDPNIAWAIREQPLQEVLMWEVWDRIIGPVLLLRGADSDLLTAASAEAMRQRGPGCELVEIAGVGHTPALMDERQIGVVRDFLSA